MKEDEVMIASEKRGDAATCGPSPGPGCSKSESDTPRTLIQVKKAGGYRTETEAMAHMVDFCKQLELELDSANRELQARGKDIETLTTALEYARKDLSRKPNRNTSNSFRSCVKNWPKQRRPAMRRPNPETDRTARI